MLKGLDIAWCNIHRSGIAAGFTQDYFNDESSWETLSQVEANHLGFATPRGSEDSMEDIAEYVAFALAPTAATPGICAVFVTETSLTPRTAIPYAKLVLLRAVNAIPEAAFQECTHSVAFDISTGIHFPDVIDFTSELAAGQVEIGRKPFFDILGSGPNTYRVLFELELAPSVAPTPLGLHRLDSIWWGNLGSSEGSGAYLGHEDPLLARVGEQGLVLVTESSEEQVVGAVFGLVLQNSMGINTDSLPFGTFAIR